MKNDLRAEAHRLTEQGYMILGQQEKRLPPKGATGIDAEWKNEYVGDEHPNFLSVRYDDSSFGLDLDTDPAAGHATGAEATHTLWTEFVGTFDVTRVRTGANTDNDAGIYHFQMGEGVSEDDVARIRVPSLDVIRRGHRFAVVRGTHPKTAKPYAGDLPHRADLPVFTAEMLAWWLERSSVKSLTTSAVEPVDMPTPVPVTDSERRRLDFLDSSLTDRDWSKVGGRKHLLFGAVQRAARNLNGTPAERMGKGLSYVAPYLDEAHAHSGQDKQQRYASVGHFWQDNAAGLTECLQSLDRDTQGHSGTGSGEDSLADVLNEVAAFNARFIFHKDPAVHDAVALWIAHTFAMSEWNITPRLYITAPQAGAGKSTQGALIQHLSLNGVKTGSVSPAYVFGKVSESKGGVTLLLDEADNIWARGRDTSELQALVNEGFQFGATVGRGTANKEAVVSGIEYQAYCPVVIIGIRNSMIPATTLSRCINVNMSLPTQGKNPERFILRRLRDECSELRSKLEPAVQGLSVDWDTLPPEFLELRDWDIWEPLFAVAKHAGGDWPERVERAARAMSDSAPKYSPAQTALMLTAECLVEIKKATPAKIAEFINGESQMFELDGQRLSYYLKQYGIDSHKSNGQRVFFYDDVAAAAHEWSIPLQKPSLGVPADPAHEDEWS